MQEINWNCCPFVAQNPVTRAFIEQIAKERKAPSTIENYSRDLNDFLSAFPDTPFSDILEADESRIADYVDWLWKREAKQGSGRKTDRSKITYTTGSKLAPATIRRRLSTLRSFYRWSIRLGHRRDPLNPVREGVRGQERGLVPVPTSVPWIPDERQWKTILKHVLSKLSVRDQAIVLLAHDGALRREEIVRLHADDIDWRMHTITIRAEITKNNMPGIVVLSSPTWVRLKEYIEEDRAALVRCYNVDWNGPIFLSDSHRNPGCPITKWTVKDIFDRIRDDVRSAIQPNPKDIQEDSWFKLIWAACTLTKDKLHAFKRGPKYPLAYFRAACLIWVTAARRSDEIWRLSVGCVSREWAPEMYDEKGQQVEPAEEFCYLRIPTNKMKVMRDYLMKVNP